VVKEAYGFHSAKTFTPVRAAKLIKNKAALAMKKVKSIKPIKLEGPVTFDVTFKNYRPVEALKYLSIVERINSHTIRFIGRDMVEVADFRTFLLEYNSNLSP